MVAFLEKFFQRCVAHDFTAGLERDLDRIASGDAGLNEFLRTFRDDLEAALEQSDAMERRDILAAIEGPSGASGLAAESRWPEAGVRFVRGVGPESRPAPHVGRPFKGSGMPVHPCRAFVAA